MLGISLSGVRLEWGNDFENFFWRASEDLEIIYQVKNSYSKLKFYIARDALGFGIIDVPMKDDNVEEVSCEGWDKARLEAELNERADFLKDLVNRRKLSMVEITRQR